jgi:hypothetical protein
MREHGAPEGILSFVYWATSALSRYDATSHFLPIQLLGSPCILYATTPSAGCNAHFASFDSGAAALAARARHAQRHPSRRHAAPTAPGHTPSATPPTTAPSVPANPATSLTTALQHLLAPLQSPPPSLPQPPPDDSLKRLLNYLLK